MGNGTRRLNRRKLRRWGGFDRSGLIFAQGVKVKHGVKNLKPAQINLAPKQRNEPKFGARGGKSQ